MADPTNNDVTMVGLVSDTHGWVHPFLHEAFEGAELIVHAGDIGRPEVLEELETIAPIAAVKGNIDGGDLRFLPLERVDEVAGVRIAALHIAGSPRSPRPAARNLLARESPDVLVVGHSHVPVVGRVNGALWINPGAAGREGHHDLCFAARLLIGADGEIGLERIHLGVRGEL
jgi:putative phosphoesterase